MKTGIFSLFILAIAINSNGAFSAIVLDFDDTPVAFQQGFGDGDKYVEDDYFISTTSDPGNFGSFIRFNPYTQNSLVPNNGTTHIGISLFANPWLQRSNGGVFSLLSLDVAEYSEHVTWPSSFDLTGHKADGSLVFASLLLDQVFDGDGGVNDFQHYQLNWDDLVRVDFTTDGVAFDNLEVVSVPIPSGLFLFLSAIVSLTGIKFRRNA